MRAVTEVVADVLSAADIEAVLREQPELAVAELRRLSRQMRQLTERYALRCEELQTRLLELLSTNLAEQGEPVFRSTREELAGWVAPPGRR